MADIRARGFVGERTNSRSHDVEEIVPTYSRGEEPNSHYLRLTLPDFRKDDVRLDVDNSGNITISGERLANHEKYIYFEQTFPLPYNTDIDNISANFEGQILHVTLPNQVEKENKEIKSESQGKSSSQSKNKIKRIPSNKDKTQEKDQDDEDLRKPGKHDQELSDGQDSTRELDKNGKENDHKMSWKQKLLKCCGLHK